jgi:hypothetical protein
MGQNTFIRKIRLAFRLAYGVSAATLPTRLASSLAPRHDVLAPTSSPVRSSFASDSATRSRASSRFSRELA